MSGTPPGRAGDSEASRAYYLYSRRLLGDLAPMAACAIEPWRQRRDLCGHVS